jgi:hypothetical protein
MFLAIGAGNEVDWHFLCDERCLFQTSVFYTRHSVFGSWRCDLGVRVGYQMRALGVI